MQQVAQLRIECAPGIAGAMGFQQQGTRQHLKNQVAVGHAAAPPRFFQRGQAGIRHSAQGRRAGAPPGARQARVQGFQVGQQVAVVVVVGRLPRAALGVRKAVAVVAMRLVGAPGVRRRELQVRRFARQAHGVAEVFAAQHGVIKAVREDAGRLVVDAPAGRDDRLRAHFNEGRGQAGGQFRPRRDGVRAHVAQVAAIDEDELRHAFELAHLRRRQPRLRPQHQARMGDAVAGQVDGEIAPDSTWVSLCQPGAAGQSPASARGSRVSVRRSTGGARGALDMRLGSLLKS